MVAAKNPACLLPATKATIPTAREKEGRNDYIQDQPPVLKGTALSHTLQQSTLTAQRTEEGVFAPMHRRYEFNDGKCINPRKCL
jgi:hypothetical protein